MSGAPQGSALGPVLYITRTDNLSDTPLLSTDLFVSDPKCSVVISEMHDTGYLQSELDYLQNWSDSCLLWFSLDKYNTGTLSRGLSQVNVQWNQCKIELHFVMSIKSGTFS